jgi:hypothetical protein
LHFLDLMPRSMPVLDDTADKGFAFMPAPANLGSELWVQTAESVQKATSAALF